MKNTLVISLMMVGLAASAGAGVITQNTLWQWESGSGGHIGQSMTTPAGGPWENIGFNFFQSGQTPYALGDLYLLSQEYLGLPANLSSSTTGYLSSTNTINSGVWQFTGVILQPNTQYFFYAVSVTNAPILFANDGHSDPYAGGAATTASPGFPFAETAPGFDFRFDLTGDVASGVPEPGTLGLFAGAAVMAVSFLRHRKA